MRARRGAAARERSANPPEAEPRPPSPTALDSRAWSWLSNDVATAFTEKHRQRFLRLDGHLDLDRFEDFRQDVRYDAFLQLRLLCARYRTDPAHPDPTSYFRMFMPLRCTRPFAATLKRHVEREGVSGENDALEELRRLGRDENVRDRLAPFDADDLPRRHGSKHPFPEPRPALRNQVRDCIDRNRQLFGSPTPEFVSRYRRYFRRPRPGRDEGGKLVLGGASFLDAAGRAAIAIEIQQEWQFLIEMVYKETGLVFPASVPTFLPVDGWGGVWNNLVLGVRAQRRDLPDDIEWGCRSTDPAWDDD